jgi:ABC-type amino acid transport substrate-binding protein/heme exporter protein D
MRIYWYGLVVVFFLCTPAVRAAVLTPAQDSWLTKHKNTILVRPEKQYPPFSFISSSPHSTPKGLAVDYIELIARKVGAVITYTEAKPSADILSDIREGKEGVVLAVSQTDAAERYLYFSESFMQIPAVIVTRRDYNRSEREFTLGDFTAKQVALTKGYAVEEFIKNNYPKIILDTVSDDEVALQKVLLGEVDAAVMDLASLSYYTSRDMLSYVQVSGQTGFEYKLSFAVPKSMPDAVIIINAGLKEITPAEHTLIKERWVTFPSNKESTQSFSSFFHMKSSIWVVLSVVGAIVIVILLIFMVIHSRTHHRLQIAVLAKKREKEHQIQRLTNELKELEEAQGVLGQNMQEIRALEEEIKNNIDHLSN